MDERETVSVLGGCVCGGSHVEPNFECERCRLVYFVRSVADLRKAQRAFFATYQTNSHERPQRMAEAKRLELRVDNMLEKLTKLPKSGDLFGDQASGGYYEAGL